MLAAARIRQKYFIKGTPRYDARMGERIAISAGEAVDLPTVGRDWLVVLFPTALSLRNLYSGAPNPLVTVGVLLLVGLLVAIALLRPSNQKFPASYGPMVTLFAASALVIIRPTSMFTSAMAILVGALSYRLASTVEVRRLVVSLIDGLGLYCLANIALYTAGIRSGTEREGWRLFLSSGGENRIIYPLERSLSLPPVIAAMFLVGVLFLIRHQKGQWRVFRILCIASAVAIILGSATRVPAAAAVTVAAVSLLFPAARRYLAATLVLLAAVSAIALPKIVASAQYVFEPLAALLSSRRANSNTTDLAALNGREFIWSHALKFWDQRVTDPFNTLFGFGMEGHYRSGASGGYFRLLSGSIVRDPERILSVHNSFLQQLFDAGIFGWLLLAVALVWIAVRLSSLPAPVGVAIASAFSVLIICSMTEVLLHPNVLTYWILLILAGVAAQAKPPIESASRSRARPPASRR
ncbi:O-antigen ligase family protein [Mycolicibacterium gilvum]|uniref:O-antigen ligase family protein n=1 Tax=Mycolicibacterium gilvum TaxID=1804 RepID=UPI004045EDE6